MGPWPRGSRALTSSVDKRELERSATRVVRGRAGDAVVVLVGGDAGIGKTRLVAEVAGRARESGALVLEGGCVSLGNGEGLPFAPIVEAFRRLPAIIAGRRGRHDPRHRRAALDRDERPRAAPARARAARRPPSRACSIGRNGSRPGSSRGCWRCCDRSVSGSRSCSIVEDLHWADSSTRDVLSFLARNARTRAAGRHRDVPDGRAEPAPSAPALAVGDGAAAARRADRGRPVRPVGARRADHGDPRPSPPSATCSTRSSGAPRATRSSSRSCWRPVRRRPATGSADPSRRAADARHGAVGGRAADPRGRGGRRSHGGAGPARGRRRVDEAEHRGTAAGGGRRPDPDDRPVVARPEAYRFRHALLAEAVYDDLLPSERRRLHAAYAAALDARPVPEGAEGASHLAALAHHATAAHEPVRALRAWVARRPRRRRRARLRRADAGLRAGDRAVGCRARRRSPERHRCRGACITREPSRRWSAGGHDRAVDLATAAVDRLDPDRSSSGGPRPTSACARALWISGGMDEGLGDPAVDGRAALERPEPSPMRARIMAALAGAYMLRGDHPRAIAVATRRSSSPVRSGRGRPRRTPSTRSARARP